MGKEDEEWEVFTLYGAYHFARRVLPLGERGQCELDV